MRGGRGTQQVRGNRGPGPGPGRNMKPRHRRVSGWASLRPPLLRSNMRMASRMPGPKVAQCPRFRAHGV